MNDSPDMRLVELNCGRCAHVGTPILHMSKRPLYSDKPTQLGAYCSSCKAWIAWVKQSEVWLSLWQSQQSAMSAEDTHYRIDPVLGSVLDFAGSIAYMAEECWRIAEDHGFHTLSRSTLERAMLVVTELSELSEAARNGTLQDPSEHIPEFTQAAEEWADVLVRVFDHSRDDGVSPPQLGQAFVAKLEFNRSRSYRHGGKTI